MTVEADDYRAALRRHPAGVVIVTLMSPNGPVGFTATSFASLSLNPPLVCFNITDTSSSIGGLRRCNSLVVHLLGAHQLELARRFSRSAEQRFADQISWAPLDSGEPVLRGTPTWLRANVHRLLPAGDSTLAICLVTRIHRDPAKADAAPLLYHDGSYASAQAMA